VLQCSALQCDLLQTTNNPLDFHVCTWRKRSKNIVSVNCVSGIISSVENVILIDALHSLLFHLKNTTHIIFDDAMFNIITFFEEEV
jgi:hypothetical protein